MWFLSSLHFLYVTLFAMNKVMFAVLHMFDLLHITMFVINSVIL
jgi:hypothetical protein